MDAFLVRLTLDFGNRPRPAMDENGRTRFSFGRFIHPLLTQKATPLRGTDVGLVALRGFEPRFDG